MKKTKFFGMMLFAFALATTACNNVKDPDPEPSTALPISETFDTGLGKFTTQSVSGDQVWAFDSHKYALISGWVDLNADGKSGVGEYFANEDWLISPEIDLAGVTAAKLTFDHVARYFADIKNDVTVWVSSNYVSGLPSTAIWTQLATKTFTDPGTWTLASSGQISLTAFAGKKIKIAFKYLSTTTKAGTWELKNFLVSEGEATVDPTDVVSGDGSEASPYNVAAGIVNQGASKWVKGYIVGYVVFGTPTTYIFTSDTCTVSTNILIAGSKTQTDVTRCMAVQLPTGAVQTGLNLKTTKTNLGKEVTMYGSLEAYFGKPGLKTVSYYALEGGTTGGTKPVDTSNAIFTETFASSSQGNFTVENVVLPAGFTSVWLPTATYGMSATGYKVSNFASEGWLISPAINLAGKSNVTLTFEHAIGPAAQLSIDKSFFTVWICNNYVSGNPNNVTWTKIDLTAFSTTAWGYITANLAIPSANLAANAKFAFKYMSTSAASATWEIKNVVVK